MEQKIIFATGNEGKMKEIREILGDLNIPVQSMKEANIEIDIEESGETFEENSLIKATEVAKYTDAIVLADDSGLEIDALDKEPGVLSSRYLGEDTPYEIKNKEILIRMDDVPWTKRTARFVCAITVVFPDGAHKTIKAAMEGMIGYEAAGENGFGYDPIFYVPEFDCTSAQLTMEQKNQISHRGKALEMMKEVIKAYL
ncbi:XTP/dITP diphosphatase [Eubacterium oxidoreducens]|uniref:dITP/XTP pyrophosphatase n=1 Tax=Eubacterium oxidoreducens TaxID=1732 RepID=A0A1G6ABD3_EUBOX|nr:XTP/dITP diphosphatase [Eubacterium oxidoreducens]SDB05600.1 XTP/dITP diphosphohydrolase [Eubacterium oxidoreducens]